LANCRDAKYEIRIVGQKSNFAADFVVYSSKTIVIIGREASLLRQKGRFFEKDPKKQTFCLPPADLIVAITISGSRNVKL